MSSLCDDFDESDDMEVRSKIGEMEFVVRWYFVFTSEFYVETYVFA
jgi:hypothetical protein